MDKDTSKYYTWKLFRCVAIGFFIQWQPAELVFPCIFPSDPRNVASNSVLRWKPCASAERFCFRSMQRQGHFCRTMSHLGAFPAHFSAKTRWIRMIVWGSTTERLMFYYINHDLWERCCESGKVCWIKSSNIFYHFNIFNNFWGAVAGFLDRRLWWYGAFQYLGQNRWPFRGPKTTKNRSFFFWGGWFGDMEVNFDYFKTKKRMMFYKTTSNENLNKSIWDSQIAQD